MQFFQASPWRDPRFFSCSVGFWSWYLRCFLLSGSWTPVSLGCFSPYRPYVPDMLPLFVRIRSNRTPYFIIHSSVTHLRKFLIHYLRYLCDCLCYAVFFLQYIIWMFPAPPWGPGPPNVSLLPAGWRSLIQLSLIRQFVADIPHNAALVCPLILTHKFPGSSLPVLGRALCVPAALSHSQESLPSVPACPL